MALLGVAFVEVVLSFAALVLAILFFRKKRDPRYPPGPPALPLIGNLLQLGSQPQGTLMKWAKEYGPVFSVKMGSEDVIVLNDHKIIKDVFQDSSSSGRTNNPVFLAFGGGNYGVIMSEGAHWEQQRRFTLRKLRDYGFAKNSMEVMILDEVNCMVKWFEQRLDKPITGNKIFNGPVVNSLWKIISGERNDWDTADEAKKMLKYNEGIISSFNRMNASGLMYTPVLRHIAPDFFGWTEWVESLSSLTNITSESVKKHAKVLDKNNPQDFIDHYIIEKENATDPNSSFYKETGEKNLRALLPDLFVAGAETTSHTLSWAMLLLAHNQTVQAKLHKELDDVVGQNRIPSVADRPRLPYTEAVLMEVLRMTAISSNGVPHRMLRDAVFHGYFFPKNATVIANIFMVQNDPKTWGDPETFRPERFLSPDGSKVVKNDALITFSVGKRQCLGESLARDSLILFLTGIFQKFHVKADPSDNGQAVKSIVPTAKMLNEPDPFKIIVSLRK